jgi:pimeloyl-ACP methyl ester carboxylesterase
MAGYGRPGERDSDLSPHALARAVVDALTTDGPRLVVLGHSASCQVAAHVAALAPDRVAGLVLVGPTTDPRAASWPRLVGRWLATARREPWGQVPVLARHYRRTTLRAMARGMEAARRDALLETLARSTTPVLVARGVHDRICPADWAARVAASGGPGSRSVTVPAGGHMIPLTHGDVSAAALAPFVAEVARD